jgi:ribosomal-protein-alanine N-acetyltransferase
MELLGNRNVWQYLPDPFPAPFTEETARTLIEVAGLRSDQDTVAIELDGRPVGQCLLRLDRSFANVRAAEIAYWLGEEYWGRGWMSRILPAFTHRSFQHHPVDVIYAWIKPGNEASARVAARAGYRRDSFSLESQLAEVRGRAGFARYATYRADCLVEPSPAD